MKRRSLSYAVLAAGLALASPVYGRVGVENVLKHSFRVSPGGVAYVATELGSIDVTTHRGDTVEAQVIRRVPTDDREAVARVLENFEVSFDQKGNDVYVTARRRNRGWMFRDTQLKVKIILTVPTRYNVDLKTSGGNIGVADLQGEVEARTSGGNLRIGRIQGEVMARTSGGNIDLRESRGNADISTSGGNILIGDVEGDLHAHTSGGNIRVKSVGGKLSAETSGGDIEIEDARGTVTASTSGGSVVARLAAQPTGDSKLSTSGGNVTVYLAKGVAVDIRARASGGGVHSEIPMMVEGKVERSSVNGKINGGGPTLILSTSGGAVEIKEL
jgi:DUF4097 and DUF4098 domain-containing protein YvlB